MENNELYRFIDLPVSVFMQHAEEEVESTNFADLPISALMHCDEDGIDDDTVEHSGIKGMKWGVRRYQNKDGSLTPAGKKRYAKELSNIRSAEKVVKTKQATKAKIDKLNARKKAVDDAEDELDAKTKKVKSTESKPKQKTIKEMTDEELQVAKKRLELERDYMKVYKEVNPQKESMGKDFVKKVGKNLLDAAAESVKTAGKAYIEKKLKEALGVDNNDKNDDDNKLKKAVERLELEARGVTAKDKIKNSKKSSDTKTKSKEELELEKLQIEKKRYETEQQVAALKELKKNNWQKPKKDEENK